MANALTKVTGNVIDSTTNITAGIITATSFVGSGANLTGVASTDNIRTNTNATFLQSVNVTGIVTTAGVNASGVITATSFSGSGANLTGVASTDNIRTNTNATFLQNINVTGIVTAAGVNASGVVTATSFSGSGANLTGLAATANVTTSSLVVIGVSTVAAGTTAAPSITPTGDSDTGIFFPSADTIAFGEGGAETMRVNSSGELLIGTGTRTANGGVVQVSNGITFPATQSACSDVNTLDDYEEGTWTPNLENTSGIGLGSAYNTRTGAYTKIGNVVYWNAHVDVATNNASCTGNMRISGFPYSIKGVSSNVGGFYIGFLARVGTNLRGTTVLTASIASSTALDMFYLNSSGNEARVQGGSDFVNPIILMAGFYYF